MIEQIIIGIVFLIAIIYLVNMARKSFSNKQTGCAKGCGTCSPADLKKGEPALMKQQKAAK
jgi:hypothetical protein